MKFRILLMLMVLSVGSVFAQETKKFGKKDVVRCSTVEYEAILKAQNPKRFTTDEFEAWIKPFVDDYLAKHTNASQSGGVITIPVVVHVIHSGQNVGVAPNITDAQVQSQITVMNNDYRKLAGTPGYNTNPVGADTMIQFALAKQDPNGNPTNGIDRVNLCQTDWNGGTFSATASLIDSQVKPATIWDPTQYMNMWSVNFGSIGLLGYAQFPSNSGLSGLNTNEGGASTDGVVANYATFGSKNYNDGTFLLGAPYDEGRTMTHEVGHFLGLRHLWGDGLCDVDDFCNDTPNSSEANDAQYNCNLNQDSCPSSPGLDMVQNYMNYTNDACMNIFTNDQKARIAAVMNNSPRRSTLKTSTKDADITLFANDAEVQIDGDCSSSSSNTTCGGASKRVALYNRGTSTMTTAVLTYSFAGGANQTYNWNGSLTTHKFAYIDIPAPSAAGSFNVAVTSVNGVADQRATNNTDTGNYGGYTAPTSYTTASVKLNLQRDKYGTETTWNLKNVNGATLYSGGPYTDSSSLPALQTFTFNLANNMCYTFTINDSEGDGICCGYGNGYYNLKTNEGVTISPNGGSFGTSESKTFVLGTYLESDNFSSIENTFSIYPNPNKGMFTISAIIDAGSVETSLYDVTGKLILNNTYNHTGGEFTKEINTNLPAGFYMVNLKTQTGIIAKKLVIE